MRLGHIGLGLGLLTGSGLDLTLIQPSSNQVCMIVTRRALPLNATQVYVCGYMRGEGDLGSD